MTHNSHSQLDFEPELELAAELDAIDQDAWPAPTLEDLEEDAFDIDDAIGRRIWLGGHNAVVG